MRSTDQNYYQILEIETGAPHHEVVAAYQRAKDAYAPDSPALYTMFSKEEADALRRLVEEAYLILGNQTKRKEYDSLLLNRKNIEQKSDLPDFSPEKSTMPQAATVPTGFTKGRHSVYEVDEALEKEIAEQTHFDGAYLSKIRKYKKINIDQISKETRISRSYLMAIESEDFEALPAPVFLRGFIIQIARALGLNENLVASSYMSRVKKGN